MDYLFTHRVFRGSPFTTKAIYAACVLWLAHLCFQEVVQGADLRSITLAWDWYPGASNYTAGPEGNVVFDIYMRNENDYDGTDDNPVIGVADDCWWNVDHYSCQVTEEYEFERGVYYFFVIAYLLNAPTQRSNKSNEARYVVDLSSDGKVQESSSGGGCFIDALFRFFPIKRLTPAWYHAGYPANKK